MPPAAILDVDGTLVDTNYHHAIAWYRAFRQHGEVLPIWRIHRHIGMGGDHLVKALCGDEVEHYLDLLDAREIADGWTTAADVRATKPDPDLVQAAIEKSGADDAVMVGDSTWDCEAAKRAGLDTLAVLTGGFSEAELREAGAVAVFQSIDELRDSIDEWLTG
jgi:phosphoglycolate phosphatase-like HAD superfamily hydrolase